MSRAWAGGSTRRWRKLRAAVLMRDAWICQLCYLAIDPRLRPPHPKSATVHHIDGKAFGDNPHRLVAAHRDCNQEIGDPNATDPRPQPRTEW